MTPREIIANVRDVINASCFSVNQRCDSTYATAVLEALHSAGYRILGPGEWDKETVEKCAEVAAATDPEKPANWLHRREEIATAIRALAKEKQG